MRSYEGVIKVLFCLVFGPKVVKDEPVVNVIAEEEVVKEEPEVNEIAEVVEEEVVRKNQR